MTFQGTARLNFWKFRFGLAAFVSLLFLSVNAQATEVEALISKLPRAYSGDFKWDGDKQVQTVSIRFESVQALSDQEAEAVGCGAYAVNNYLTKIKVRMLIQLPSLYVQILEQSPQGNGIFEADGSHRGNLSKDLQRIDAQWTTTASGQRGQLHLHAEPSASCTPARSL